jgi:hypothetical protein
MRFKMIYYRLALQKNQSIEWEWASAALNSFDAILELRQQHHTVAEGQIRVFLASSVAYMDILLVRENLGLPANSWTMEELMRDPQMGADIHVQRFEAELGWDVVEGELEEKAPCLAIVLSKTESEEETNDYDEPYVFALPSFMPHTEAWLKLMIKVRSGELVP